MTKPDLAYAAAYNGQTAQVLAQNQFHALLAALKALNVPKTDGHLLTVRLATVN